MAMPGHSIAPLVDRPCRHSHNPTVAQRPAIFFDRDNTLIVGSDYLGDPDDVVLMPGAADAVSRAKALGFATVVVSNQSAVARGMFTEADVRAVNTRMEEYLLEQNPNAIIDRQEYCPFHPEGKVERYCRDSDMRKPKPGMIIKAADLLGLDLNRSWVIGDAPRDIEAGKAAGCKTILFQPPAIEQSPAAMEESKVEPDYTCTSLMDAIDYVSTHSNNDEPPPEISNGPIALPEPAEKPEEPDGDKLHRLERLAEQILEELRRRHDQPIDFSVSKLMAGIAQILALAVLFVAYLNRATNEVMFPLIFTAIFCQLLTIALLIMDRQR
jgi:D-glycero-D-manno-heptose 1,7-bisphosphate phosphatase